ncbi:MAG: hypothetical protein AB7U20_06740 [Planctomycetaceae bacterium]
MSFKRAETIRREAYEFRAGSIPHGAESERRPVADGSHAGRKPLPRHAAECDATLAGLCHRFLMVKRVRRDAGTLSSRSFEQYDLTCRLLIDVFGRRRRVADIGPTDFERLSAFLATRYKGSASIWPQIMMIRVIFKSAVDAGLIKRSVSFGTSFRAPTRVESR